MAKCLFGDYFNDVGENSVRLSEGKVQMSCWVQAGLYDREKLCWDMFYSASASTTHVVAWTG